MTKRYGSGAEPFTVDELQGARILRRYLCIIYLSNTIAFIGFMLIFVVFLSPSSRAFPPPTRPLEQQTGCQLIANSIPSSRPM